MNDEKLNDLRAVASLLTEAEIRQELKAGPDRPTKSVLLSALRKLVVAPLMSPQGFEPRLLSSIDEPYFTVAMGYSQGWLHPEKATIVFFSESPPAWPFLAEGYCTADDEIESRFYVVDAKKEIWVGADKDRVIPFAREFWYFLDNQSFQDTTIFKIFGQEPPRPDWMDDAEEAGWAPKSDAVTKHVLSQLSQMCQAPPMWGSPESFELQYLQLLEVLLVATKPRLDEVSPRFVLNAYERYRIEKGFWPFSPLYSILSVSKLAAALLDFQASVQKQIDDWTEPPMRDRTSP